MQSEFIYLVLGCFGRVENNFKLCSSVENPILRLDDDLIYHKEIWDYFESVQLLDKPMLSINAIRHLIFNLQEKYDQKVKRLWTEMEFHAIERFIHMHKDCGLFAKLLLLQEEIKSEKTEEKILIKAAPNIKSPFNNRKPIVQVNRK